MKIYTEKRKSAFYYIELIILVLSFAGVICYHSSFEYNYLPTQTILDIFFIVLVISGIDLHINRKKLIIFLAILIQLIITLILFKIRGNNYTLSDYVWIYKVYAYILLFCLPQRYHFSYENLKKLLVILIFFMLIKYIIAKYIFVVSRPGLLIENNFELMTIILLYFTLCFFKIKMSIVLHCSLFLIILISGSRSAAVCLVFSFFFLHKDGNLKIKLSKILLILIFLVIIVYVFIERMKTDQISSIDAIDRVKFLSVFMTEIEQFSFFDYFIGRDIITPLSIQSCQVLSFYADFYQQESEGMCFSVVLHSFILRTIFDHGIIGLIIVCGLYTYFIKSANFNWNYTVAIVGIAILNGLSVSSFNSIFFNFPLYLILLSNKSLMNHLINSPNK